MKTVGDTQLVSLSEASSSLPKIVKRLQRNTVLMRRNNPVAALVSIEKYNNYLGLEKLIRHPELFDRLRKLAKQAGNTPMALLRTMENLETLHKTRHQS
ncbi:MAG: type II toxin-antitoxin system Phd/YefM family antitoxin [Burkholderiales bacterium]